MRNWILAGLLALVPLMLSVASAQEDGAAGDQQTCPDEALQAMFNYQMAVAAGTVTDAQTLYNVAENASRRCPDNMHVLSYASLFYGMVASTLNSPQEGLIVYSKAYDAALAANAKAGGGPAPAVSLLDGSSQAINPYGQAYTALKDEVFPELTKLAVLGHVHAIYEAETLTECPYKARYNSGVETEADAYAWNSATDATDMVTARLEALKAVCSHETATIVWALGKVNARAARHTKVMRETDRARAYAQAAFDYTTEFGALPSSGVRWEGQHIAMRDIRAEMKADFLDEAAD